MRRSSTTAASTARVTHSSKSRCTTCPDWAKTGCIPKEQWLVELVRDELAQGRNVGVFLRQTGTRDIQPRIEQLIREHVPGAKPFVLKGSVAPERRESLVQQQLEAGCNVLITNPRLVATGLDLVAFPTLVFYEIDYSLFTMVQASRRAWRIIQDRPCQGVLPVLRGHDGTPGGQPDRAQTAGGQPALRRNERRRPERPDRRERAAAVTCWPNWRKPLTRTKP